ncbi:nucleotidyltransferase domain-containing protein [Desulfobulbus alkaliphilus]|uniref:nucleotidyltransferase domain-containing protein n=1 Tax=Desulfobulbus alkaliphilus TaxID=869814 RepID=UPI0019634E01|nr:nucleotidyltransferase domain-containing protein [Desulfobulbus alkaliphilus]MBM9538205.1 nucleotidyltransferase domain-containing protein [Desulfobulbus alkaliphilus]
MNERGIPQQELAQIQSIFRRYPDIARVVLFGSRAKGTARPSSDIDLAVEGIQSDLRLEALALDLDELPLPYRFDVKAIATINNPALLAHIDRVGVVIYP